MLDRITIDHFATIDHLEFDLGRSLNIITGETGAGKSVLVQAISTALGGRADISMVRTGQDRARIQILGTRDGEEVVISRELLAGGKSVAKLNGEIVPLARLREFCTGFADIHGQYDNQQILNPDNHITITDSYNHDRISGDLDKLADLHAQFTAARARYNKLLADEADALRQREFYQYEFDNITALALHPDEDSALAAELDLMRNSEKIYQAVNGSYVRLHEREDSVLTELSRCMQDLSSVAGYGEEIQALSDKTTDLYYQLEDISQSLRDITYRLTFSEDDMDRVSSRLSDIETAKRKYRRSVR